MRSEEIVRSWKDEEYQLGLSDKERALLPDNPAGVIELNDADLYVIDGGTIETFSALCPPTITGPPMCITVLTLTLALMD